MLDIVCIPAQQHLVASGHSKRGRDFLVDFAMNHLAHLPDHHVKQFNAAHITELDAQRLASEAIANRLEIHIKPIED